MLALVSSDCPWSDVVNPEEVARVLESYLVEEVPANPPDYARLKELEADSVMEIVIEEYGMRSARGRAGWPERLREAVQDRWASAVSAQLLLR